MRKPPTVYDVAALAGVSIATVSRVLRSPGAVKEATRERVAEAVKILGYVPSASARGLAARRTNVIGLFLPGRDDAELGEPSPVRGDTEVAIVADSGDEPENESLYYDEVLRGAELEAGRRGFALMIASGTGAGLEALVTDLAGRVDGLGVLAGTVPQELLAQVARRIPVVVLGGVGEGDAFDHVHANNGPGMRALAKYLVETKGVSDFVYVAGPESADDDERLDGFREGVGIEVPVIRADFTRSGGRDAVARLEEFPRAIVCANDQMALGALDVLASRGVKVPEDVLVTGFDGIAAGRHAEPSLTTVHQPMAEIGRAAIHVITARLENPELGRQALTLPVRVVLRGSTG